MSAWIRFINKTDFEIISVEVDEDEKFLQLYRNIPSKYKYSAGGTTRIKVFIKNNPVFDTLVSAAPGKLNTFILKY